MQTTLKGTHRVQVRLALISLISRSLLIFAIKRRMTYSLRTEAVIYLPRPIAVPWTGWITTMKT